VLRGHVGELELFAEVGEPCGMELPAVCMEEIGGCQILDGTSGCMAVSDDRFQCVEQTETQWWKNSCLRRLDALWPCNL